MSFRNRLTLFFVVIVVAPMVATAAVVGALIADVDREEGRARLDQAAITVGALSRELQMRAGAVARGIGGDSGLANAIRADDREAIARELRRLTRDRGAVAARLELSGEGEPVQVGLADAVAPGRRVLMDADRERGTLSVSLTRARDLAREAERRTDTRVVILDSGGRRLAGTLDVPGDLRGDGEVQIDGDAQLFDTVGLESLGDQQRRLHLLRPAPSLWAQSSTPFIAAGLVGALLVALLSGLLISRSLQAEVNRLLDAARRIGRGEFETVVPADGHDDFAQLGHEFNRMAAELRQRVADLDRERTRLHQSVRRVGESFAKGLDRESVLKILTETAVDGTSARCGRTMVQTGEGMLRPGAEAGDASGLEAGLRAAEAGALEARQLQEARLGDVVAMAHPLRVEQAGRVLGVLSVAREGDAYTEADRDLLQYLAGQAAISIENVALHETVQRQAVTDGLTGLFNHRHLQEVLVAEVERTKRFDQQLGLIMLDIDDFKRVNDAHGHLQGDLVLREVARVLRETAREIDIPARYGGEEMAVVLPQTDLTGAYRFAERVRRRIERLELPLLDGPGTLRVTASLGVAATPGSAAPTKDALVAAADSALYRAKRDGKNRTEQAAVVPAER